MRLRFLGTGASGGTPGQGRSRRRESSGLVTASGTALLLDATRDFADQAADIDRIDALLLTHAHRDASGGIPALRRWLQGRGSGPVPVLASREAIDVVRDRYARLDHCEFVAVRSGECRSVAGFTVQPQAVPHARDPRFVTYAWRLTTVQNAALVYASDVGELTGELEQFCRGVALLIIDGAMYERALFSHLRIDEAVPRLCGWQVERILLTQIGRTAPPHEELQRRVSQLCARAQPAHDGWIVEV